MLRVAPRTLAVFAVAVLMACLNETSPSAWPPCKYQGKTARQWARELHNWETVTVVKHSKGSTHYHLVPKESPFLRLARKLGLDMSPDRYRMKMPLLTGDPLAVPVLIELLGDRERSVRLLALYGLRNAGSEAKTAVPDLLRMLDNSDDGIRWDAQDTLMVVDREAGEDAGLECTPFGLVRHPPGTKVPRLRDLIGR